MRERAPYPLLPLLHCCLLRFALGVAMLSASVARAEETQNLLHGPHPFLKDNELSVHALIGEGQGDALSGAKLELGYGYKLTGGAAPFWLNLLLSFEHSGCNPASGGPTIASA